jgi:hypothetical protein
MQHKVYTIEKVTEANQIRNHKYVIIVISMLVVSSHSGG